MLRYIIKKILGLLSLWFAGLVLAGCTTPVKCSKTCEYKIVFQNVYGNEAEVRLNEYAKQGWDLCSICTSYQGEGTVPRAMIVLKRVKK